MDFLYVQENVLGIFYNSIDIRDVKNDIVKSLTDNLKTWALLAIV